MITRVVFSGMGLGLTAMGMATMIRTGSPAPGPVWLGTLIVVGCLIIFLIYNYESFGPAVLTVGIVVFFLSWMVVPSPNTVAVVESNGIRQVVLRSAFIIPYGKKVSFRERFEPKLKVSFFLEGKEVKMEVGCKPEPESYVTVLKLMREYGREDLTDKLKQAL